MFDPQIDVPSNRQQSDGEDQIQVDGKILKKLRVKDDG
jgi:hypothetical protein